MTDLVWITGAGGFLGSEITAQLTQQARPVGIIGRTLNASRSAALGEVEAMLSAESLDRLAQQTGLPEVVFHLAGGSSVGRSIEAPEIDYRDTVGSSQILFDWLCVNRPSARVVLASSAAVYGTAGTPSQAETTPLAPISPYGMHKVQAEALARDAWQASGLRVLPVRLFSLFGPRLRKQIFWDVAVRVLNGNERDLTLKGSGQDLRDWMHVSYAARVLDQLAQTVSLFDGPLQPLNLGAGTGRSVQHAAQVFVSALDPAARVSFSGIQAAGDPPALVADVRRLREVGIVGPTEDFDASLEKLAQSYKEELCQ